MSATIKDIAKMANVSTATVSNVLTQKRYVSTELTQRVAQAVEALDYRPNVYARSLKTNRSYTIGVQVPDITNPFFSNIVKTIQREAIAKGYQIVLFGSDNVLETEQKNVESMLNAQVDGIISIAPRMDVDALLTAVEVPLVIVDRSSVETNRNVGFVYSDNYFGAAAVADYLAGKGYQRFICLAGPVDLVVNARLRRDGFLDTLRRHGIPEERCIVRYGDFTFQSGYELMSEILEDYSVDGNPAAAFVTSDMMAWGAMEALKERKLKMPRDMGIVGYDNVYFANYLYPKLTTVQNPSDAMARDTISLMLDALENRRYLSGISVTLRSSLIVRKSC